jgi:hypothetical protein
VAIDNTRLLAMCADADGCKVSLATVGWRYQGDSGMNIQAPWEHMSCRMYVVPGVGPGGSDAWSVSEGCGQWYATWPDNAGTPTWGTPPGFFAPYRTGFFGYDGYDGASAGADRWPVLHDKACYFAESAPNTAAVQATFVADNAKGFSLIASHPSWAGTDWVGYDPNSASDLGLWPASATDRACVLVIED